MTWDWTVNLGNVMALVILLGTFIRAHIANLERMKAIETKMDIIYEWFKQQ